eukprot:12794598-Alexandrium_andersonii.AAC.1
MLRFRPRAPHIAQGLRHPELQLQGSRTSPFPSLGQGRFALWCCCDRRLIHVDLCALSSIWPR